MPESIDVTERNNGFARMPDDQGQKDLVARFGGLSPPTRHLQSTTSLKFMGSRSRAWTASSAFTRCAPWSFRPKSSGDTRDIHQRRVIDLLNGHRRAGQRSTGNPSSMVPAGKKHGPSRGACQNSRGRRGRRNF